MRWYRVKLKPFADKFSKKKLSAITVDELRRWRSELARREISEWTLHGHIRAVRHLFVWLVAEGKLDHNPATRLELPRLTITPRQGIANGDMLKMIRAAKKNNPRDYALLCFLADTGCRVGGVVGLRWEDVDLKQGIAFVTEKGNKSRPVFMLPRTIRALKRWHRAGHKLKPKGNYVFMSFRTGNAILGRGIYSALKRIAQRAGVTERWNPHQWRHGAARGMLQNGASVAHVQQLLGHSDPSVTILFYGSFSVAELKKSHRRYSWLNR